MQQICCCADRATA